MKNLIHKNNEDSSRFCYRDTRINQTRVSHAPLFYDTVYKDKFTKDLEEKTGAELSVEEVRNKCFQLLGFLEQYQMLPSNEEGLDDFVNQLELADFDGDNLDAFVSSQNSNVNPKNPISSSSVYAVSHISCEGVTLKFWEDTCFL